MIDETAKDLSQTIANLVNRLVDEAYQKGYTKGIQDGPKAKEVADELMGVVKPVVPKPCVRGIDTKTLKALFLKLDEEVDEFKAEILSNHFVDKGIDTETYAVMLNCSGGDGNSFRIAEEGADVATMIATICNAVGIDEKTRFEAQAYVNKHNHERGRI